MSSASLSSPMFRRPSACPSYRASPPPRFPSLRPPRQASAAASSIHSRAASSLCGAAAAPRTQTAAAPARSRQCGCPPDVLPPSVTFFGDARGVAATREGMVAVPVETLDKSGLPRVTLVVNGVAVPALLDTGSPITVLNAAAATAAGIQCAPAGGDTSGGGGGGGFNPFARAAAAVKAAQSAARGDMMTVAGADGPVQLFRAEASASMALGDAAFGDGCRPYVGDLPGLAALDGLGAGAGPAAVLGTDVLRTRPRMVYTPRELFL